MKIVEYPLMVFATQFTAFTKEEEIEQFSRYKAFLAEEAEQSEEKHDTHKSNRVREAIFNHNLKLIFYLLRRRKLHEMNRDDFDDLILILSNHLWEIIPKFKTDKGYKFSTFASFCLNNRTNSFLKKNGKYNERYFFIGIENSWDVPQTKPAISRKADYTGRYTGYDGEVTEFHYGSSVGTLLDTNKANKNAKTD